MRGTPMIRVASYERVSRKEQVQGYSLDAQARAFHSLVDSRERWGIYREWIEPGKSAYTEDIRKRPVFLEAIQDAEAGKYDVLVVHRIDRFSRKLRITLEYFEKLGKADVGFVSIENQIDYSTPSGRFMLTMQGGLAELYSANLGQEVKKGLHERRAQGLYVGLLPFGAIKGEDGVPVPHPERHPGLQTMFQQAAQGKSDREIAVAINSAGYRTSGNRGPRPFTKDSVRGVLTNRFYVGELSDGNGGWIKGRHTPFVDAELFEQVREMRSRRRTQPKTIKRTARTYSLSGLLKCADCEGPMWIHQNSRGRARIYCKERTKRKACQNRSTFLDVYEAQVSEYLRRFIIPEDYQARILALYRHLDPALGDSESRKRELEGRLELIGKLYEWGDKSEEEYLAESREIKEELSHVTPEEQQPDILAQFQRFLVDVSAAWEAASQEQRNRLARQLFDFVWVKKERVVAVRPRSELRPFFQISEECQKKSVWRPRPESRSHLQYIYLLRAISPAITSPLKTRRKLQLHVLSELRAKSRSHSLRQLAREYGVSYETVRLALAPKQQRS